MRSHRSKAGQDTPSPLLQQVYGCDNVVSLRELLLRLSDQSTEAAAALRAALHQPHDHADYAQGLLQRTWCVLRSGAPLLRSGFTLYTECNQLQLVSRAVEWLLGAGQNKSGGGGARSVPGMATAESFHYNSTTASLCSPAWQLLLSRIGDTLMLYLLLNASMFTALPNACCLQLSGPPLSQVARAWRKAAPAAVAAAATHLLDGAGGIGLAAAAAPPRLGTSGEAQPALTQLQGSTLAGGQLAEGEVRSEPRQASGDQLDDTRVTGVAAADADTDASCTQARGCAAQQQQQARHVAQPPVPAVDVGQLGPKKARPSSWQRRRAAQLRQDAGRAIEQQQDAGNVQLDSQVNEWGLPRTQELEPASSGSPSGAARAVGGPPHGLTHAASAPAAGSGLAAVHRPAGVSGQRDRATAVGSVAGGAAQRGSSAGRKSSWPPRMPRPTDMSLQRSGIFYCASFPRKPGLTTHHVLSKLSGSQHAERCLFAAIFDPKHSPVGRLGATLAVAHSAVPPSPRRIPARQRHLLPLLSRLIERAAKCPFAILLQHHCPLPAQLREVQQQRRREQVLEAGRGTPVAGQPHSPRAVQALHHQGGAEGALHAATAGTGAAGRQLPLLSQGAALQQARWQRVGLHEDPTAQPNVDFLLDELFHLDQQHYCQAAPQQGELALKPGLAVPPAPAMRPRQQEAAAGPGTSCNSLLPTQRVAMQPGDGDGKAVAADAAAAAVTGARGPRPPAAVPAVLPGSLSACFVPHKRVVAFVWAAIRAMVPGGLLGDSRNRRVLREAVSRFVRLRRYEQVNVHQMMKGLRITGMPWLQQHRLSATQPQRGTAGPQAVSKGGGRQQGPTEDDPWQLQQRACPSLHAWQQRQLALWVLVVPLLRAHFYCTESEAYRQQVFYYRKPVWAALSRVATKELQEKQFTALPQEEARSILQERKLGVARLRLLPKRTGMRFIVNLGRASTVKFPGVGSKRSHRAAAVVLQFKPVNHLLQNVYQVLRFEASRNPELLGASVFGYNDAYCKLHPFLRKWRAAAEAEAAGGGALLQPFLVSVDVSRAFDSVDIQLLLSLVEPLLRHEQYLVLKYWEVVPSLGQAKVIPRRLAAAAQPEGAPSFPQLAQGWAATHKGKAFTDQVVYDRLSRQQALDLLRQHLTANLVRIRRRWCSQGCGIAQGSTLSTLLCSLYLAHLERTQLDAILQGQLSCMPLPCDPAGAAAAEAGIEARAAAAASGAVPAGHLRDTVVFLGGSYSAAVSPATVLSVDAAGDAAATSSGSKGMLTALARAADSMATAQHPAGGPGTPQHHAASDVTHATPGDRHQLRGRCRGGGSPTGDLLLLPAGVACGAAWPSPAAAAAPAGSPCPPTLRRSQPPAPLSSVAASGSQQAAAQLQLQPLGCSRVAVHAGSVLLRLVDDFLLITAVPAVAQGFASRMLQGFDDYNVYVNPDKTKLSFALQLAGAAAGPTSSAAAPSVAASGGGGVMPAAVWRDGHGSTFVKWCGLLLNSQSLEIQADYTRYCGEHIATSLTLPLRKKPGAQLAVRLCQYLRPKVHPLLLDSTINSPQTVRLNVYQAFLLAAMKFHCYVKALPAAPTAGAGVLLEAILSGITFMAALTRRSRVASAHYQGLSVACSTHRKQTRYTTLLAQLQELVDAPALRSAARQLAPVVDPARNSVFDAILY
ncbi:Telomerase reverse transcriptase [Chlorella vulgaris]